MTSRVDIGTLTKEVKELHEQFAGWTLDNAFVHWFLRAFLVADSEISARAVTGVSHDKGVDGIYIDDDSSKVFIFQGKFHQGLKPPLEKRNDVLSFARLAQKLAGVESEFRSYLKNIDPSVGQKLEKARNRIRRRHFGLHLYYVTTGKCSSPLKDEAESEVRQANGRVDISVLDRGEILTLLLDYLGGAAPPVPYLDLRIDARGIVGSDGVVQRFDQTSGIESWVFTMAGTEIGALFDRSGDRLFARNIRGFLGDTAINRGIHDTLRDEPEHFWYFNNGVTIVCDKARKTAEHGQSILRVSNPQIINGQQTTRTLHSSKAKRAAAIVRVISIPRDASKNQDRFERLVSNIVAATNWQNAILPSDLRANDSRQVELQRNFARLRYDYLRKRQTKREAKRQLGTQHWFRIKKEELAQVVAACDLDPVIVRSGKEGLFKPPVYDDIFDGRSLHEYLAMYWLGRLVKHLGSGYPNRSYAKWHVLHSLWELTRPTLRSKRMVDYFIREAERNRWNPWLDKVVNQTYLATLDFFRKTRGQGEKAVDVSNFFYRPNQHKLLKEFWSGNENKLRRARTMKYLEKWERESKKALETG